MMRKVCAALITSLSVALTLASNQAFGQWTSHGGSSASKHSPHHHRIFPQHHNRRQTFFPGFFGWSSGGFYDDVPNVNAYGLTPDYPRWTCTYDIPWDWVHRCPPIVAAPEPPLVPVVRAQQGCFPQAVTVPGADGKDQTITVVRC